MVAISSRELNHGEQAVAEVQYHYARVRRAICHAHVCLCCVGSAMPCCCEGFMYCRVLLGKIIKQTVNTISVYSSPCYLLPSACSLDEMATMVPGSDGVLLTHPPPHHSLSSITRTRLGSSFHSTRVDLASFSPRSSAP
jgi:hypothetical protein